MRPLKMNEKFLTLVGLCEPPPDVTTFELCLNTAVGLYVLTTLCLDFISSSFFVIQYKKREMEDILGSILQVAAVASEIIGMISLFAFRKQMKDTFSLFQTIYNECSNDSSFWILEKINQLCVKVTRILVIKYLLGYLVLSVTLAAVNVTFCYIKDDGIDTQCLYVPYKHVLPWDDEAFVGWFFGLVCSFWMSGTYFFINGILLSFFIATSLNFHAFQRQFDAILSQIKESNSAKCDFDQNSKQAVHRAIRFHALVKELFFAIKDEYAGVLFAQLFCGATFIAASLFQMDMAIHHLDIYFYAYVNAALLSTANLYLYCYAGANVTVNCLKCADDIFEKDWYLMPVNLQQHLIMMIQSAHRPLIFTGYGIFKLNMETFTSILKTVMSYYLMFKTLTE